MATKYWRRSVDVRDHDFAIEDVVSPEKVTPRSHPTSTFSTTTTRRKGRRLLGDDDTGIDEVLSPQKTCLGPRPTDEDDTTDGVLEDIRVTEEIVHNSKRVRLVPPATNPEATDDDFDIEEVLTQYIPPPRPKDIPYHIRNTRTFYKQLEKFLPTIDVDIVICYVWQVKLDHPWQALVKDSNNFFSVVETSSIHGDLLPVPGLGQRCRLEGLVVLQVMTPAISTVLFSVFDTIGHYQNTYLRLRVTADTKWTEMSPDVIEIPYEEPEDDGSPTPLSQELEKLKFSSLRNGFVPSFLNVDFSEMSFSISSSQLNTQFYM